MSFAIRFTHPGPPDVLHLVRVEPPEPGPHDVRIEVAAAGVNNADLLERRGHYPVPPNAPPGLGLEVAGTITALGSAVTTWKLGDRVCALVAGGGYAEAAIAPAAQVMPVPAGLSMIEAAALPEVACTVYSNLAMIAGLKAGQAVLIHGAGGGIGSFAIQWATAIGAQVITTAGSEAKTQAALDLGAVEAVNYRAADFVSATLDATDGRGVDAILDIVGTTYLRRNMECLADDGHLVIIGGAVGPVTFDLWELLSRRASISATLLRGRPAHQKAAIVAGVTRDVLPLLEAGEIRAVVDTVFPLAEASLAHELLESGRTVGKVVLETSRHRPR
ncbi:NAD(P)H-quinone oxidoreductase [Herbiconiux sp. VKM Ac-1786]|uniref:NAD(P)H-quinone oxidoreductase n=1 Tax=Herbiconiux sp. VKM Ac-1786 TaxID=2783824 RepID=UPI00188A26A8|nr:NAD(P)H-quinone oxidoreductase [Herbiconiux sp. VKM Ac-1786]MBF4572486.1 NAD(P)H-quinone oxidoreductase [Herbiconiux sp. VKM Ac-1786]